MLSAKGKQDKQWENNKLFGKRWIGCRTGSKHLWNKRCSSGGIHVLDTAGKIKRIDLPEILENAKFVKERCG